MEADTAWFYGRVSTLDDESVDSQLRRARERAHADGFVIPNGPQCVYADDHVSGARRDRNGLERMIQNATSSDGSIPKPKRVYIREKARLWRGFDPRFPSYLEYLFLENGIQIHYVDVERNVDYSEGVSDADIGQFISDIVDTVNASRERTRLTRKFREKRRELVIDGFFPAGPTPYGLERILVDRTTREFVCAVPAGQSVRQPGCRYRLRVAEGSPEAEAVRFIYRSIEERKSLRSIARALERQGMPSPAGQPKWGLSTVANIASSEIYMGTLVWGRRRHSKGPKRHVREKPVPAAEAKIGGSAPILYENFIAEPLISREQFEVVQEILAGKQALWSKRRACNPAYLLTGKVVCATCGIIMYGYTALPGTERECIYYRHRVGYKDRGADCPDSGRSVRADLIEPAVLSSVRDLLASQNLDRMLREELAALQHGARLTEHRAQIDGLRRRIRKQEQRFDRAVEAQLNTLSAEHQKRLAEKASEAATALEAMRAELASSEQAERDLALALERPLQIVEDAEALIRTLDTMARKEQRSVVERVVHAIRFYQREHRIDLVLRVH